jgi:AcrR family transcriptional regulator
MNRMSGIGRSDRFDREMVREMAGYAIDRRVARTRATLHEALMSLIMKKRYEAISIKDICDAANVGRSTFCAHYASKDNLRQSHLATMRKALVDRQRDAMAMAGDISNRSMGFSLTVFEHARSHLHLYRAQGGRSGSVFLDAMRQILSDLVREELAATPGKNSTDAMARELAVEFVVGAFMAVMTWWLDDGAKLPPQQIDAMFRRLATEGAIPSYS